MSTLTCDCDDARLGNLAQPECTTPIRDTARWIIGPAFKADGTRNFIDSTTLTSAAFADRLNRWKAAGGVVADEDRLWITPVMQNVESTRSDSQYKDYPSGYRIKLKDGDRDHTAVIPNAAFEVLAEANKICCQRICIWEVDSAGTLIGQTIAGGTATALYGVLVAKGSFDAKLVRAKAGGEVQEVHLMFRVDSLESDQDLKAIPVDKFTANYNLLYVEGPYNISGTKVSCSQTVLVINIYAANSSAGKGYNSFTQGQQVKGLVVGDIKVFNVTDQTELTPSSVVEDSTTTEGVSKYTITVASQTVSDDLRVRVKKARLDSYYLEQVPCITV